MNKINKIFIFINFILHEMGFEPMNHKGRDLKPRAFDHFATRVYLNRDY